MLIGSTMFLVFIMFHDHSMCRSRTVVWCVSVCDRHQLLAMHVNHLHWRGDHNSSEWLRWWGRFIIKLVLHLFSFEIDHWAKLFGHFSMAGHLTPQLVDEDWRILSSDLQNWRLVRQWAQVQYIQSDRHYAKQFSSIISSVGSSTWKSSITI